MASAKKTAKVSVKDTVGSVADTVKDVAGKAVDGAQGFVESAKPKVEEAAKAVKQTAKKAASAVSPEVYFQWNGQEFSCSDVETRVKADFKANNKRAAIRSCRIYIKPEDGMVYYVINDVEGKIAL